MSSCGGGSGFWVDAGTTANFHGLDQLSSGRSLPHGPGRRGWRGGLIRDQGLGFTAAFDTVTDAGLEVVCWHPNTRGRFLRQSAGYRALPTPGSGRTLIWNQTTFCTRCPIRDPPTTVSDHTEPWASRTAHPFPHPIDDPGRWGLEITDDTDSRKRLHEYR